MSPFKDWLNLFAVSVSATVSVAIFGKFLLSHKLRNVSGEYICELLVLFHRGENKQAAEKIHWFPSLKLRKHEIVWKQHTTFLNRPRDDSKDTPSQKHSFH